MEKSEKNELAQFIDKKKAKRTERKTINSSSLRQKYTKVMTFIKNWSYSFAKLMVFSYFVYKVEYQFMIIKRHIAKNGGIRSG